MDVADAAPTLPCRMGQPATSDSPARPDARPDSARGGGRGGSGGLDLDAAPFTIAWEVTRSCAYACLHCRADAQPRRDPGELSTEEGRRLIDQLAGFDTRPILVLTGGDPPMRRDP